MSSLNWGPAIRGRFKAATMLTVAATLGMTLTAIAPTQAFADALRVRLFGDLSTLDPSLWLRTFLASWSSSSPALQTSCPMPLKAGM
jgi:hypothetical protein